MNRVIQLRTQSTFTSLLHLVSNGNRNTDLRKYEFTDSHKYVFRNKFLVPRGGIEPPPIDLKDLHFLDGALTVYLPVYPVLSGELRLGAAVAGSHAEAHCSKEMSSVGVL